MAEVLTAIGVSAATRATQGILDAALKGLGGLLGRDRSHSRGGATPAERLGAYRRFRHACLELRSELQSTQALPKAGLVGLVTTVPTNLRLLRRVPALATELSDSALDVALIGTSEVVRATSTAVAALNTAMKAPGNVRTRTAGLSDAQQTAWHALDVALTEFTSCARADLNLADLEPLSGPVDIGDSVASRTS